MDVLKRYSCAFFLVLVVGCDNQSKSDQNPQFVKSQVDECVDQELKGEYLVRWKNGDITVEKSMNENMFIEEFLETHKNEIEVSEPHYQVRLGELETNTATQGWGGYINWGAEATGADQLFGRLNIQETIVVAVIDSGLDVKHPQISGALAINRGEIANNGIDDDNNGYVDDVNGYNFVSNSGDVVDYNGHGTHVAGIIAAQHDAGAVLGAAPNAQLMPLPFISQSGGGDIGSAILAIRYAADNGARVINASWGGRACSELLKAEIDSVADQGVLFVTAAGNSGNDLDIFPEFPAAFSGLDNMLTVGASTYDANMAAFSNYGERVDVVAPGANIHSTYPYLFDVGQPKDGIASLNGTSMAAPFVAAAAAVLWSVYPEASYQQVKEAILDSVRPGPYYVKQRGELDIPRALDSLENELRWF